MGTYEIIVTCILWICCNFYAVKKQKPHTSVHGHDNGFLVLVWFLGPVWLFFAMIRQTFFEDWK